MRHRTITIITGAILAVAVSGAPAAADSASIPETFSVLPGFTVNLEVDGISYGDIAPGSTAVQGDPLLAGNLESNCPMAIEYAGSDFTGPVVLGQDTRSITVWGITAWPDMETVRNPSIPNGVHPTSFIEANNPVYTAPGPCDATHWCPFGFWNYVDVGVSTPVGDYSGEIELTFYSL